MEDKKVLPKVNLSTENYDIISTGSVVLQMGEFLEFQIANLKFRIEFIEEKPDGDKPLEGRIVTGVENKETEDAYYKIVFYNQASAYFSSTPEFAQLATIDGRPLRFKFSIHSINEREDSSDKIFFYTWYLGKEASIPTNNNVPQQ